MTEVFRRRLIWLLVEKDLLSEEFAQNLLSWRNSGFSIDNSVRSSARRVSFASRWSGSAGGIFVSPSLIMCFRVFAGRIGIAPRLRLGYAVPFFDYRGIDAGNQMLYGPTALEWDFGAGACFCVLSV